MNYSDSERFASVIEDYEFAPTDDWRDSDLLIINSCSVKQQAEDRVIGLKNEIDEVKKLNPGFKVVLTGCMTRRKWDKERAQSRFDLENEEREEELRKAMPWLDYVLETKEFHKLPAQMGLDKQIQDENPEDYLSTKPRYKSDFQAFVPISTGCNHFCTFCIVPYARGKEICRSAESIISEVTNLVKGGFKDITLLGQTVNRWVNPKLDVNIKNINLNKLSNEELNNWKDFFKEINYEIDEKWLESRAEGHNLKMPIDFLQLIQVLDQLEGRWWTSWTSSHPQYMTDELIKFIGESSQNGFWKNNGNGHQRPGIHFAMQSGNNKILRKMNRGYSAEEFLDIIYKLRKNVPDLGLSTDIIVGYPSETRADFEDTRAAMERGRFDMAFISAFSPRKGTAAGRLNDDIDKETKQKWKKELNDEVLAKHALERNKKMIGEKVTVLIDSKHRKTKELKGKTAHAKTVQIKGVTDDQLIGEFLTVVVTNATPWALEAELNNNP